MIPKILSFDYKNSEQEHDDDGDDLDDPELWCDLTLEDQRTVDVAMAKKQC